MTLDINGAARDGDLTSLSGSSPEPIEPLSGSITMPAQATVISLAEAFPEDVDFNGAADVLAFYRPERVLEFNASPADIETQRAVAQAIFDSLNREKSGIGYCDPGLTATELHQLIMLPNKFPAVRADENLALASDKEHDEFSMVSLISELVTSALWHSDSAKDQIDILELSWPKAPEFDQARARITTDAFSSVFRAGPNSNELSRYVHLLELAHAPAALINALTFKSSADTPYEQLLQPIASRLRHASVDESFSLDHKKQLLSLVDEILRSFLAKAESDLEYSKDKQESSELLVKLAAYDQAIAECKAGIVECGVIEGKVRLEDGAFSRRSFESVADVLSYFNPERVAGFDAMHWQDQQLVAIELFTALKIVLEPEFFRRDPKSEDVKNLLEIVNRMPRGQLHELPSGPVIFPIVDRIANLGLKNARTVQDLITVFSYEAQSAAEWESQQRHVVAKALSQIAQLDPHAADLVKLKEWFAEIYEGGVFKEVIAKVDLTQTDSQLLKILIDGLEDSKILLSYRNTYGDKTYYLSAAPLVDLIQAKAKSMRGQLALGQDIGIDIKELTEIERRARLFRRFGAVQNALLKIIGR